MVDKSLPELPIDELHSDIRHLITQTKQQVFQAVNKGLVLLYWHVGSRIQRAGLKERAEYGKEAISQLAKRLQMEFGRGFSRTNLFNMLRFYEAYPDEKIVHTLCGQLGWSHFRQLIYIEDPLKRQFYTELCRIERWSSRLLDKKIDSMLYERTAISQKPEVVIQQELDKLSQTNELTSPELVFRDPYILDFLNLPQDYSESDLEGAILDELASFIQEFGTDFCFVARQKRITIDNIDYFIDLLFYHRGLRRLVVLDLKLGKFLAAHKGQMELYLRWIDKYERREGEGHPLGLILCSEKKHEHVELLELDKSSIHVAQYLTELPPRDLLERKLHEAIRLAKEKVAQQHLLKDDAKEKDN